MDRKTVASLLALPFPALLSMAARANRALTRGKTVDLCSIVNAKSGRCSEDCRFCAQSGRYPTKAPAYPLLQKTELLAAARRAKKIGAKRFDIVTSGNRLTPKEFAAVLAAVRAIRRQVRIKVCASLGSLTADQLRRLKRAGLTRYHHNLETSERFFPKIATTHTWAERVATVKAAKAAGLETCSGGIIGMGETMRDRIDLALTLARLGVDSVPLNVHIGIPGTPLAKRKPISPVEVIRTIALFRILLPTATIHLAAGRESLLKDYQALAFYAGAGGMLIGGYLTIPGRPVAEDKKLVREIEALWRS